MRAYLAFSMMVATLATATGALAAPSDGSWAALSTLTSTGARDRNDEHWRLYNRCVRHREFARDAVRGQDYADERTDPLHPRRVHCGTGAAAGLVTGASGGAVAGAGGTAFLGVGAALPIAMIVSTGILDIVLIEN